MDEPRDVILGVVGERQVSYGITYMWNLKKLFKNVFIKHKLTHIENKFMATSISLSCVLK